MNLDSSNFTHEIRIVTFHLRICLLYLGAFLKLFFWFNQPIYVCAFKENVFPNGEWQLSFGMQRVREL